MPIYEYKCDACGNQFEELLLGSEPDPDACPKCDADGVHRVISNTSFQLKGGGWYVTDYKSSDSSGTQTASSEASGTSTESETTSDTSSPSDSGSSDNSGGSDDSSVA